jgi:solute carrier family 25 phosphate transporter 23/24/25/41
MTASQNSQQIRPSNNSEDKPALKRILDPHVSSYFIAGGLAGAASRTVVSPLERIKIIQSVCFDLTGHCPDCRFYRQVQPVSGNGQYKGVWNSLVRIWKEEGFLGFMRGNGINCLRIVPYSAVQFTTYEQLKKVNPSFWSFVVWMLTR